jgi:rhodanese-related sulfurtransferase
MGQPNRFQKLVAEAKRYIKEISPNDAALELGSGTATLIDVRSDEDWKAGHAPGAKHLNRGEVEVEIEEQVPDLDQRIICYCGGGSRSALVAESLQKMGYRNVRSMTGGFRGWKTAGLPTAVD